MPATEAERLAYAAQKIRERADAERLWNFQSAVAAICGFQPSHTVAKKAMDLGFSAERLALEYDPATGFRAFASAPRWLYGH